MIHLEKIDARNLWDIIDLKVAKAQKGFVAPNDISILQAENTIKQNEYTIKAKELEKKKH